MKKYEGLVKALRLNVECRNAEDALANASRAADAIEELEEKATAYAETLHAYENPWTMITSRPMTAEEREEWEYVLSDDDAIIYTCPLPDDGQEILTCDKYGTIRLDTFEDDPNYGCGLEENGDMDGIVAWMPLPKAPKGV